MRIAKTHLTALFALTVGAFVTHPATALTTNVLSQGTGTDMTLYSNVVYVLADPFFVTNGATLTIQPGTLIRGQKETSTDPGALVISRGSKIRAMGTADNPIIMTDMNDDMVYGDLGNPPYSDQNNGIAEQWGGLILLGRTYIASKVGEPTTPSPNALLELQIEGLEPYGTFSKYGGGNDDDDSGEVHYLSIRYGGFVLGDANEINGMTFGAVGRETDIDHVEVFQNKDDAFEWFGGTVNTKYIIGWMVGDDTFDWDEGFRGKGQFWLCVQGPLSGPGDKSDKGAEMDGGHGDTSQPSSCPTIYNATFIGHGSGSSTKNAALHFRDGTGGRYYNTLVMDFDGACTLIEGDAGDSDGDSASKCGEDYVNDAYYTHESGGKKLELKNCVFHNMGFTNAWGQANNAGLAVTYGASDGDENKPHYGIQTGYDLYAAGLNNTYEMTLPIKQLDRNPVAVKIGSTDYYPVTYLDPTLKNGSAYLTSGKLPPNDGFFIPLKMVGAMGSRNWASWSTAYNNLTLYSDAMDDYENFASPVITDGYSAFSIVFPTVDGQDYDVEKSSNNVDWEIVDTVIGTGSDMTWTDLEPMSGAHFYRISTSSVTP